MNNVKITQLTAAARIPLYATSGAGCFDLHACIPADTVAMVISPGKQAAIGTGLAFAVPPMHKMAIAAPQLGSPVLYTKKQLAIIERYRAEMAAAGGMFPIWWQHKSSTEIAQAAIEAVRGYKP